VLLQRSHEAGELPDLRLDAEGSHLALSLPKRWLDARPLLHADLALEPEAFAPLGIALRLSTH
jgi:exopolyphosphatase/guanosine-5'-triphosphate,3'-diphosphate pyrophosphatase